MAAIRDVDRPLQPGLPGGPPLPWWRDTRKIALAVLLAVLLLLPAARPLIGPYNYVLHVGHVVFMWIAMASSWNIIGGYAGYISLGHNVFYAIGGYISGMIAVYVGVSPFITAPLAGVVASLVGLLVGLITLRTRGPAFIISTIALLLMVRLWFDNWDFIGASNGLSLPLAPYPREWAKAPFYYAMFVAAAAAVYLSYRIRHSKFGLGLRAIASDEVRAEVAGIDVRRYKVMAFSASVFFVAVVGALWGYSLSYLRPTVFLTIAIAAEMVLMVIIGGRGTVAGPVIGATLLVLFNEAAIAWFGTTQLNIVVTGSLMILVLLFFPLGIVGTLRDRGRLPRVLDWG